MTRCVWIVLASVWAVITSNVHVSLAVVVVVSKVMHSHVCRASDFDATRDRPSLPPPADWLSTLPGLARSSVSAKAGRYLCGPYLNVVIGSIARGITVLLTTTYRVMQWLSADSPQHHTTHSRRSIIALSSLSLSSLTGAVEPF